MTTREAQLRAIEQERTRQDEQWRQVCDAIARLGDEVIPVPADLVDALTTPVAAPPCPVNVGIRA